MAARYANLSRDTQREFSVERNNEYFGALSRFYFTLVKIYANSRGMTNITDKKNNSDKYGVINLNIKRR